MFGGAGSDGRVLADSWAYEGTAWRPLAPAQSPPGRKGHTLSYDPSRGRLVLFGGSDASGFRLGDTWEWDGSNWSRARPELSPPARSEHHSWHDAASERVVVFSGRSASSGLLADAWEWNGSAWLASAPAGDAGSALTLAGGGAPSPKRFLAAREALFPDPLLPLEDNLRPYLRLDGSASVDSNAEGRLLGYRWTQTSGPPVTLSDPRSPLPTFVPSSAGRRATPSSSPSNTVCSIRLPKPSPSRSARPE